MSFCGTLKKQESLWTWNITLCTGCRIQKDLVDPEKLQATLTDETLNEPCGLKRALEIVALLEAQLKEMNPNLDSISEYDFICSLKLFTYLSLILQGPLLTLHNMINRYRTKVSLYNERVEELNKVTQQRDDIKRQYDEWRKKRHAYLSLLLCLIVFFISFYTIF